MLECNLRISRDRLQKQVPTGFAHAQPLFFSRNTTFFLRLQAAGCILRISMIRVHISVVLRGSMAATCVFNLVVKQTRTARIESIRFSPQSKWKKKRTKRNTSLATSGFLPEIRMCFNMLQHAR